MTIYSKTFAIAAMAVWPAALLAAEKPAPAQAALKAAIDKEMVDGDLKSAIALYEKTVAEFKNDRATAAKALLRIGQCYEKLGAAESRKAYERVVREFSDQSEQVAFARGRLSAVGQSIASVGVSVRQVWTKPGADVNTKPVFGDGRRLAYIDGSDHDNLALADLLTGETRRLTEAQPAGRGGADFPAVSPDSKLIAYQWEGTVDEVRVINADGSSPRVLYHNPEVVPAPVGWFPDGKHLLAAFFLKDKTTQIAVISVADGKARVLKSSPWGRLPHTIRISPDGRHIAFDMPESIETRDRDIYLMASDGSSENVLVSGAGDDVLMDWTPDGKELFFLSDRGGSISLWAMPMSGSSPAGEPRIVKANIGNITSLGFARNGSFYFTEAIHSGAEVLVAALDPATGKTTGAPKIASNRHVGTKGFAAYSPDGNFLAYQSGVRRGANAFGVGGLTIQSLDTGKEYDLSTSMDYLRSLGYGGNQIVVRGGERTRGFGQYDIDPRTGEVKPHVADRKSADGKKERLAQRHDGGYRLVERDLETGKETIVVPERSGALRTTWIFGSPNKEWTAYHAAGAGETRLMAVRAGGGDPVTLVSVKQPTSITAYIWSRDGRYILYAQGVNGDDEVWRVPVSGGRPQPTGFKAKNIQQISLHPDGTRVAVTSFENREANSVWVLENYESVLRASR